MICLNYYSTKAIENMLVSIGCGYSTAFYSCLFIKVINKTCSFKLLASL